LPLNSRAIINKHLVMFTFYLFLVPVVAVFSMDFIIRESLVLLDENTSLLEAHFVAQ